jgi:hypothetical protein
VLRPLGKKGPPPELCAGLREVIGKAVRLMQDMRAATPPACMLVPARGSAFVPDQHEALAGCPEQGAVCVVRTVFPGYVVTGSNRVLEKALVCTREEATA